MPVKKPQLTQFSTQCKTFLVFQLTHVPDYSPLARDVSVRKRKKNAVDQTNRLLRT